MESDTEVVTDVVLDALTNKQRQKEFKSAQKGIKSKDMDAKHTTLRKFIDSRYFTVGGCFVPFVNTLIPKKKTLDWTLTGLEFLLEFLKIQLPTEESIGVTEDSPVLQTLQVTFNSEQNLDSLKVLSDLIVYKEEVKKVKKKKGEPEEPYVENPVVVEIRFKALKCLYCIVYAMMTVRKGKQLKLCFSNIDGLVNNLYDVLASVHSLMESEVETEKIDALQRGVYAVKIFAFASQYQNNDQLIPLVSESSTDCILSLAKNPLYVMDCCSILHSWAKYSEGSSVIATASRPALLVELLRFSTKTFSEAAEEAAVDPKAKGKKAPPPKKGEPPVVEAKDPQESIHRLKIDEKRQAMYCFKSIVKLCTILFERCGTFIEIESVQNLCDVISKLMINPLFWDTMRQPFDPLIGDELGDTMLESCITIGTIGSVSADAKVALSNSTAINAIFAVLFDSKIILQVDNNSDDSVRSLLMLRRSAEKAILNILTKRREGVEDYISGSRWSSNALYQPEVEIIVASREREKAASASAVPTKKGSKEPAPVASPDSISFQTRIVQMIRGLSDSDLSNRGIRIIAALLKDSDQLPCTDFLAASDLYDSLPDAVSKFIFERSKSVISTKEDAILVAEVETLSINNEQIIAPEEADTELATKINDSLNIADEAEEALTQPVATKSPKKKKEKEPEPPLVVDVHIPADEAEEIHKDLLVLNDLDSFYLSITVLEILCLSNVQSIVTFGTQERVTALAELLTLLGPAGSQANTKPKLEIEEQFASLYDPRKFSWRASSQVAAEDSVCVRTVILDVLAIIASADSKNRTYETDIPSEPCVAIPSSKSVCEQASHLVCKHCTDACSYLLLSHCRFDIDDEKNIVAKAVTDFRLEESVLNAALGLMAAIGSCGILGIYGAVESVANNGFKAISSLAKGSNESVFLSNRFSLRDLAVKLAKPFGEGNDCAVFSDVLPTSFQRPLLFSEAFPDNETITNTEKLSATPSVWPFVTFMAGLVGVLSDPIASRVSTKLAVDALSSIVRFNALQYHSQAVVSDILAACFISIGGAVALCGLLSRFGNLNIEDHESAAEIANYIFSRGHCREAFWKQWELDHRAEVVLDPKTGKPVVKPDDKGKGKPAKDNKKDKNPPTVGLIAEIALNLESTEAYPDPNRGPDQSFWNKLLEIRCEDLHECCSLACPLTSAVQGSVASIASLLITLGVDLNQRDAAGHTAIMYALVLGDATVTSLLIDAGADMDAISSSDDPIVKFSLLSLIPEDIERTFVGHHTSNGIDNVIQLLGGASLLPLVLSSSIDVLVCDSLGYSPLLLGMGLGVLQITIGGYSLRIQNESYSDRCPPESCVKVVQQLIDRGASVNFCSKIGMIPLHVAAARGDLTLIVLLLANGSFRNALDCSGRLPIHYIAACCPSNAVGVFDFLIGDSLNLPLERMAFSDDRTGKPQEEKTSQAIKLVIDAAFEETFCPSFITKKRLSYQDIIHCRTDDGQNILQLCMASQVLFGEDAVFQEFLKSNKEDRMALALHLSKCCMQMDNGVQLYSNVDKYNMNMLHAASLLFQGVTKRVELTEQQKRSKRVKSYGSMELNLLDWICSLGNDFDVNTVCSRPLEEKKSNVNLLQWTALHAAILYENTDFASTLLESGLDIAQFPYVHYLASISSNAMVSDTIAEIIISSAAGSADYQALLNASANGYEEAPLLLAVANRQDDVLDKLIHCEKVDLNVVHSQTGRTALHEVCKQGWKSNVKMFQNVSDRIDFLKKDTDGQCALDAAFAFKTADMLKIFMTMRKNDVLEHLLQADSNGDSLLYRLERENFELAKVLGCELPEEPDDLEDEEEAADAFDDEAGVNTFYSPAAEQKGENALEQVTNTINKMKIDDGPNVNNTADSYFVPSGTVLIGLLDGNTTDLEKAVDGLAVEQAGTTRVSPDEMDRYMRMFRKSNDILGLVLPAINESGVTDESSHYHRIFHEGKLLV